MAPKTSQLLGISPTEIAAGVFTSLGEGGPGRDPLAVFSTLLARKQTGKYGSKYLVDIAKAPGQFVANDSYTAAQIANPDFGRKVYGKRYDQTLQQFENPQNLIPILQQHGGALQFRGQSLLKNRQANDVMFDPKGNYYFDKNPEAQKTLLAKLSSGQFTQPPGALPPVPGVGATLSGALGQDVTQAREEPQSIAQRLANQARTAVIQNMFPQGILGTLMAPPLIGGF